MFELGGIIEHNGVYFIVAIRTNLSLLGIQMKANQTIDEARKYLLYVSDALHAVAESYSVDKEDRITLDKFAADLFQYSNGLEQLKNGMVSKEQLKKKAALTAELESIYEGHKRVAVKAKTNLNIVKAMLKKAEEAKIAADIEEAKKRVKYYTEQNNIAVQNELIAKREFEKGA